MFFGVSELKGWGAMDGGWEQGRRGRAQAWEPGLELGVFWFSDEPNRMQSWLWRTRPHTVRCTRAKAPSAWPYLPVALQRGGEGPLVEKQLQALVGVVVTQLLEGGGPVLALVPGVLEARRVHHHDGGHGEVMGGERSGERGERSQGDMASENPGDPSRQCPHHRDRETEACAGWFCRSNGSTFKTRLTTYRLCDLG